MVTDYEAAWGELAELVASKTQHGREGLLIEMTQIAGRHRVAASELSRVLRLYGVEVGRSGVIGGSDAAHFRSWLAGFIDGEGCFVIAAHTGGSQGPSYGCELRIRLRADDGVILDRIAELTGWGSVRREPGRNGHPQVLWRIGAKADCQALVALLDAHPLMAKKSRDYAIWREAVQEWSIDRRGGGASDWQPMIDLRERLIAARQYRDEGEDFSAGQCSDEDPDLPGQHDQIGGHDGASRAAAGSAAAG